MILALEGKVIHAKVDETKILEKVKGKKVKIANLTKAELLQLLSEMGVN